MAQQEPETPATYETFCHRPISWKVAMVEIKPLSSQAMSTRSVQL